MVPQLIAKLVDITPVSLGFMVDISALEGVYMFFDESTSICGGICLYIISFNIANLRYPEPPTKQLCWLVDIPSYSQRLKGLPPGKLTVQPYKSPMFNGFTTLPTPILSARVEVLIYQGVNYPSSWLTYEKLLDNHPTSWRRARSCPVLTSADAL